MTTAIRQLGSFLRRMLHQTDGPLSRELMLEPGSSGLGKLPARLKPQTTTKSVCGYCSTGCCLEIHGRDGNAVNLTPAKEYPVNLGMACPKGWEALTVLGAPDRALVPKLRDARGQLRPVDWQSALDVFCRRIKDIQEKHGPESVAFLGTGQIPTEELALLGALAKFGMGMIHGDGNTRQCMATSVVAYKQSFGFDAPPYCYQDFEESDVIILVGSNLCIAHPILWQRILRNQRRPKIVVIDPRKTETAMAATHHLAIAPKSDLILFYGLAQILIERGWVDQSFLDAHTTGFGDFAAHVQPFTPEFVADRTGLPRESLFELCRLIHENERTSFWWTMGVNQSYEGVRTAQGLINLALMTGNIGRPGTGANSITGQCNAMGSRLFSNTTNLLGGHDFNNSEHRHKVARTLGIDVERIPSQPSWAYDQILEGILARKIRGLWIVATNGAHSWINQNTFHDIVSRLDFLAVQDMYDTTETARIADLVFPAAGWGEKEGTFINSERRIGRVKRVAQPPGQALPDLEIFQRIARQWGCGDMFEAWRSPEEVFALLRECSRGQPCDITGITGYSMLDELGGVQWPLPEGSTAPDTHRRLFADGRFFHSEGRARFLFDPPREMPEKPNKAYPFLLLTGRGSVSQWHTQTRTAKSAILRSTYPKALYVEINPADALAHKIRPGNLVEVASQRGSVRAKAVVTPTIKPGQLFLPMHYAATNQLTDGVFDPYSRQPSYKACAARIRPVTGAT